MRNLSSKNYREIATIITHLGDHYTDQPNLHEISSSLGLSSSHTQKLFTEYVGVSPKQFLKLVSIKHAKEILHNRSLVDVAQKIGLSGAGRLHDLFVTIEGMTPGEYKNGGKDLVISHGIVHTPFGQVFVASTEKGLCDVAFVSEDKEGLNILFQKFPQATFHENLTDHHKSVALFLNGDWKGLPQGSRKLKLHIKGTDFQLSVWRALLTIPAGTLTTYGDLATSVGREKAHRAVGTAVGRNPIAYIIPCHRVIQSSGVLGNYRWDPARKKMMIAQELRPGVTS